MRPNRYFIRFAIIMALFFYGSFIDSDFVMMAGSSLLIFWLGSPMIKRWAKPSNQLPYSGFFIALCALSPLGATSDFFFTLMGFTTVLWMGYAVTSHLPGKTQPRLTGGQPKKLGLVKDLKTRVKSLNQALEDLAANRDKLDLLSYRAKAQHLLAGLTQLRQDLTKHKRHLETATYERLLKRIEIEEDQLNQTLLEEERPRPAAREPELADLPADIAETVTGIFQDSQTIVDQIKASTSGNQAELLQLHQTNMDRFTSILTGYLAIHRQPNHYFQAQDRLHTAKASMEGFAHSLKEQLRQLNENDMREFEINLRLLNATTKQGDTYEPI